VLTYRAMIRCSWFVLIGDLVTRCLISDTIRSRFVLQGVGYVGRPPTPKNLVAVLYTIACEKILANFELFFKRRAAPLTKWGRKHLQRVRVCVRYPCDPPPYRRRDTLRATPTLYLNASCIATFNPV